MQIKDMKSFCTFENAVQKVIISGCPGEWSLVLYVGAGEHVLETAQGGRRKFRTLDAVFEVAHELAMIVDDHNNNLSSCPVEIHHI